MDIDVGKVLGLVTRAVRHFEKDGGSASSVILTRVYDTGVDELWDSVTRQERISKWFLPIAGDLRVGGRFQLQGHAGGTISACTRPSQFSATWEFGGDASWIDVSIAALGGQAQLTLAHSTLIGDHWRQYGPGAVGIGWDLTVWGLDHYLLSGAPADPAVAHAWMLSTNGREFMSRCSGLWCAAEVAAGEDPAVARARADRTLAFYRGEAL